MEKLVILFITFLTIQSVKSYNVNCSADFRIYKELKLLKSALKSRKSIHFIVDYGFPSENQMPQEFLIGIKLNVENLSYKTPIAMVFLKESTENIITTRALSNVGTNIGINSGYIEDLHDESLFCTIFNSDQKFCKNYFSQSLIKTSRLVVTSKKFAGVYFLMTCHVFKMRDELKVKKMFFEVTNKNNENFDAFSYRNKVVMKNLTFEAFEGKGYELCDHMKYFLNNCKNFDNDFSINALILCIAIYFGVYSVIYIIFKSFLYFYSK